MRHHNRMKNHNTPLSTILTVLLCAGPAAAFDFDQASPKTVPFGGDALHVGFKAFGKRLAAERRERKAIDAFADVPGCEVVDAVNIRAYGLAEAVSVLQPCLKALSQKYAVDIAAAPGIVAADDGRAPAMGIQISVQGLTFIGNNVRADLEHALSLRRGRLLGFPASVETPFTAKSVSPIPAWIDALSLTIEPRQTVTQGGLRVVLFDKDDNQVEFLAPAAAHLDAAQTTVTFTRADDRQVGPFSIASVEARGRGELGRLVSGVALPAQLDAATRAAVQSLFDGLKRN